jgi:ssDNA-binding Zn-finger/Zn-ribbon topoisomerase 1
MQTKIEMQEMSIKNSQFNVSGLTCALTVLLSFWLLSAIGLGWLAKSVLILLVCLVTLPAIAFFVFRWWLKRNLVEDNCPVCNYQFTGLNQTQMRCPSCSEPLLIEQGSFKRVTPPGTIDVQAVEVSAQQIEE